MKEKDFQEILLSYNFKTMNDAYVSCREIANRYGGQMICKAGLPGVVVSDIIGVTVMTRTPGVYRSLVTHLLDWRKFRLTPEQRESFELNLKESNFNRLCSMQ